VDEGRTQAGQGAAQLSLVEAAISRGLHERRRAAEDEVARTIDAAYRIIERDDSSELKMRDLLAEAGLSTQQFYRYFASKDDFITALLEDGQQRLLGYLEHQVAKQTDPRQRLEACLKGLLAQSEDLNAAARTRPFLIYRARLHQRSPGLRRQLTAGLRALLAREITAARGEDGRASAESDAAWVLLLTGAVMEAHILDGTKPTAEEKASLLAFCVRALALLPACSCRPARAGPLFPTAARRGGRRGRPPSLDPAGGRCYVPRTAFLIRKRCFSDGRRAFG
jgi:AcrR family transcriptional regulator